ncbi:hypothetical protein [Streptomyces sp. MAI_2237]
MLLRGQLDGGTVHAGQVELQVEGLVITPGIRRDDAAGRVVGMRELM